jgi:hypothetical protein
MKICALVDVDIRVRTLLWPGNRGGEGDIIHPDSGFYPHSNASKSQILPRYAHCFHSGCGGLTQHRSHKLPGHLQKTTQKLFLQKITQK